MIQTMTMTTSSAKTSFVLPFIVLGPSLHLEPSFEDLDPCQDRSLISEGEILDTSPKAGYPIHETKNQAKPIMTTKLLHTVDQHPMMEQQVMVMSKQVR